MRRYAPPALLLLIVFNALPELTGLTAEGIARPGQQMQAMAPVGQFRMEGQNWCTFYTLVNIGNSPADVSMFFYPISSSVEEGRLDVNLPVRQTHTFTRTLPAADLGTVVVEGDNVVINGQVIPDANCNPNGDGFPLPLYSDLFADGMYFSDADPDGWMFTYNPFNTTVPWSFFCQGDAGGSSQFYEIAPGATVLAPLSEVCPPGSDSYVVGMGPALMANIVNFTDGGTLIQQQEPGDHFTIIEPTLTISSTADLQVQNFASSPTTYQWQNQPSKMKGSGTVPGNSVVSDPIAGNLDGVTTVNFGDSTGAIYLPIIINNGSRGRRAATPATTVFGVSEAQGARKRAIATGAVNNAALDVFFGAVHVGKKKKAKVVATLRDATGAAVMKRTFKLKAGVGGEFAFPETAVGPGYYVDVNIKRAPVWTYLRQVAKDGDFMIIPGKRIL